MRFKGKLKTWNEERGFGFLEPSQGGQDIFVHAKAFRERVRPQIGQVMSFEVEPGPQGKKRAKNVEIRPTHLQKFRLRERFAQRGLRECFAQRGAAALFAIPMFLILYIIVTVLWGPPIIFAATYAGTSCITFVVYAQDKSAARRDARRTPESTLHFLALAGGWPGALLAQYFLRHKSMKVEFRSVFWATVVLNSIAFVILCSPIVPSILEPFS